VSETVGAHRGDQIGDAGHDIDRDREDLRADGRPAELTEDRWGKEGYRIASNDNPKIHQCAMCLSMVRVGL